MLKYGVNMGLEISVLKTNANVNKVRLSGSIDNDTFRELESSLNEVIATTSKAVVVDMADVEMVTSAGIGVLTSALKLAQKRNLEFAMVELQPQVKKVFEIMRLMPILNVFESQLELDDYLKRIQRRIQEDGGFTSI